MEHFESRNHQTKCSASETPRKMKVGASNAFELNAKLIKDKAAKLNELKNEYEKQVADHTRIFDAAILKNSEKTKHLDKT